MADRYQLADSGAPHPIGFDQSEVAGLSAAIDGVTALFARLLYGTGELPPARCSDHMQWVSVGAI